MRAAAGFHADHAIFGQDLHTHQSLCVLLGVDVIGDDPNGNLRV